MDDSLTCTATRPHRLTARAGDLLRGLVGRLRRVWQAARAFVQRHGRFAAAFTAVVSVLVGVNLIREYGPHRVGLVLGPAVAVALIGLSRSWGLSWADLGLSRRHWVKGAAVALGAVAAVALVYAVAASLPATRAAFLDSRYALPTSAALRTALLVIPFGTVLVEEIAFRGVLQGLVANHRGAAWGLGISAGLFGLWHILPSLQLGRVNPAVAALVGDGRSAQVLVVVGAVLFTGLAGLLLGELRRRSGSLLASAGLHWAVNGLGVLVGAVLRGTGHA